VRCWFIRLARSVLPGRGSSIVEVIRFQLERFTVSIKELAEWFGLEVARIVEDEGSATELIAKYLQRCCPRCNGYLGIVIPKRKAKLPVQAINGRLTERWLSACVGIASRKKRKRNQAHDVPKR
jgi:hypothetical protein